MRALASFLLLFAAAIGFAQFDMSDIGSITTKPAFAIQKPDVKKELKLTKEQDKAIAAIQKELQKEMKGATSGTDLSAGMAVFGKFDEAGKQIIALLDEAQQKRFFEIRIQMKGPPGIADPEIAKLLEITDEQQGKIRDSQSQYMRNVIANSKSNGAMQKAKDAHDVELLALLTEDQRTKFKEIQGKPFKNARPKSGY